MPLTLCYLGHTSMVNTLHTGLHSSHQGAVHIEQLTTGKQHQGDKAANLKIVVSTFMAHVLHNNLCLR